jgi:hypothetical protein
MALRCRAVCGGALAYESSAAAAGQPAGSCPRQAGQCERAATGGREGQGSKACHRAATRAFFPGPPAPPAGVCGGCQQQPQQQPRAASSPRPPFLCVQALCHNMAAYSAAGCAALLLTSMPIPPRPKQGWVRVCLTVLPRRAQLSRAVVTAINQTQGCNLQAFGRRCVGLLPAWQGVADFSRPPGVTRPPPRPPGPAAGAAAAPISASSPLQRLRAVIWGSDGCRPRQDPGSSGSASLQRGVAAPGWRSA